MLTLVFQHGWGSGPLDFTSPGFVIDWIPLFVLVVLVGPVDGLPRVRAEPGARARPAAACRPGWRSSGGSATRPGWSRARPRSWSRCSRSSRRCSMMEMKMMGVGLSAAILHRRHPDPAGDAAGGPGAARRAGLVAAAGRAAPRGSGRRGAEPALAAIGRSLGRLQAATTVTGTPLRAALPGQVEALGVGEVVDGDARHRGRAGHPGAGHLVAVAVGERDHAGHHVVGRRRPRPRPRRPAR